MERFWQWTYLIEKIMILISFLLSILLGSLVTALALNKVELRHKTALWISLSPMLGIGISSILFIAANLMGIPPMGSMILELGGIAGLAYWGNKQAAFTFIIEKKTGKDAILWFHYALMGILAFAILSSLSVFFYETAKFNHGEWDAWSHWNLRAKYIVRAPDTWTDLFPYISHGDYPLFNSGYVARGWAYSQTESIAVPITLAFISTYSTLLLLFWALRNSTNTIYALLGCIVLAATPFFTIVGKYQFADTPLGFFILASSALFLLAFLQKDLAKDKMLLLSGLMAGLASWTKNEGLLYVASAAACVVLIFLLYKEIRWKNLRYYFAGTAAILAVTMIYKLGFGPANDMTEGLKSTGIASKITDWGRYKYILDWFTTEGATFGHWFLNPWPWLIVFALIMGISKRVKQAEWVMVGLSLVGIFVLYFITYLLSFHELYYHLSTSYYRLCFHLLPAFFLFYFTLLKPLKSESSE